MMRASAERKVCNAGKNVDCFDQHAVAGVDERTHDEVNALLGAGEHHHVADAALYASCAHMFGKQRTQLFESLDR